MANACTVQPHQSTCTYMYVRLYTPGRRRRHSWRRQHCKLAGRRRAASLLAGAGLRDRTRMVHARDVMMPIDHDGQNLQCGARCTHDIVSVDNI